MSDNKMRFPEPSMITDNYVRKTDISFLMSKWLRRYMTTNNDIIGEFLKDLQKLSEDKSDE